MLSSGPEITTADLFLEDLAGEDYEEAAAPAAEPVGRLMTIREMERGLISKALAETDGNRTHAAKILGISVQDPAQQAGRVQGSRLGG